MTSGLKGALYATLITGTVLTGGYIADRKFNLGIKENFAERLIDNPDDAAKIYLNELERIKDRSTFQDNVSTVITSSGKYLSDKTRMLTADELMRMNPQKMQESYLEDKIRQLSEDKKLQFTGSMMRGMPTDGVLYVMSELPDSTQNHIVRHLLGDRINGFIEDAKNGLKRAYDATIGSLSNE